MSLTKLKKIIAWFLLGVLIIFLAKFTWLKITQTTQSALANSEIEFPANSDLINVKDFGVKGDGITDDTLALQKAINSTNRDYQVVYFPQGTYLVSDTIQIGRLKTIQGAAKNKTIIRLKDASMAFTQAPKPLLRSMYNNNQTFGVYLRDLTVNTGKGNTKAIGFSTTLIIMVRSTMLLSNLKI
jgi:Pectate lyase superfamily protein